MPKRRLVPRALQRLRLLCSIWLALSFTAVAQEPLRLAVLDFQGDETGAVTALMRKLVKEQGWELLDEALVRAAAQGVGYGGSLNLQRAEARALGLSLGCDFYLLGKTHSGPGVALAGVFLVETRTGDLVSFTFDDATAADEAVARKNLLAALRANWPRQMQAIQAARTRQQTDIAQAGHETVPLIEVLNDDQIGQAGQLPVFFQRLKPTYTKEAEAAGITVTVELEALFQADGKVGAVTVTRWAGFGLDEAALATVRNLRFKPALLAGKEVTVRGLVRYNFRRPAPLAERQDEAERLKRSLRTLKSPALPVIKPPL